MHNYIKKYWHVPAIAMFFIVSAIAVRQIAGYALYNDYSKQSLNGGLCYLIFLFAWLVFVIKSKNKWLGKFTCYYGLFWSCLICILILVPKQPITEVSLMYSLFLLLVCTPFGVVWGGMIKINQLFFQSDSLFETYILWENSFWGGFLVSWEFVWNLVLALLFAGVG